MRRLRVIGAALCAGIAVTACSSLPAAPASPLSGSSALTCAGGSRCAAPGTVRWSVPLPGSSQFDINTGTAVLNMPGLGAERIASIGNIPPGYLATVTVAPGLVAFQQPGRAVIEAISPATGRRLWTTKLPTPRGFTPNTTINGALVLSIVAAGGMITAYDNADGLWWLVNATTGAASPPHQVASYSQASAPQTEDVLPVTQQDAVLLNDTQVQGVDAATGSVRWQLPLQRWTGYAMIGQVLYADNDPYGQDASANNGPSGQATAIQRVDLATGRLLPDLPLPPGLHGEGGQVTQFGEDPGALLVEAGATLASIDPATGRPIWTAAPPSTLGSAQAGPTGTPPTVEYLVPGKTMDSSLQPPKPGTGTNIWRVLAVSLATGKATPVSLGRSFPYPDAGINTINDSSDSWNFYGSVMLASQATRPRPAGRGGFSFTRLEGVDPQTGRVLWHGPWAGDLYVLGETFTGPPEIIAESCAPSGLVADESATEGDEAFCDSERLYAVNA